MTLVAIHSKGMTAFPLGDSTNRTWIIGRGADADIAIDEPSVSRRHAILRAHDDSFELEDLGSENGTTLWPQDLAPSSPAVGMKTRRQTTRRLPPGERVEMGPQLQVMLGRVTILLQCGTAAGATWQAPPPREPTPMPAGIIVSSPAMQNVYWLAERFAQGAINMLLLGETGVGKEVLAEYIHNASPRKAGPFVRLNCASFRGELLESELFGHERGAFTGAAAVKRGLVEVADKGTLFLDEVGEMPLDLQSRLLRFLEDRRAQRVGATETRPVDVRIVAATNRDLATEVAAGRFRSDLYFRLNGVALEIPPLRSRIEEIAPLAEHFVRVRAAALGLPVAPGIEPGALRALELHPLPGNARELRNLIDRALLLGEPGQPILARHLMLDQDPVAGQDSARPPTSPLAAGSDEKSKIVAMLDACAGNQTRAAARLGITRRALIVRLERYGIARPRQRM